MQCSAVEREEGQSVSVIEKQKGRGMTILWRGETTDYGLVRRFRQRLRQITNLRGLGDYSYKYRGVMCDSLLQQLEMLSVSCAVVLYLVSHVLIHYRLDVIVGHHGSAVLLVEVPRGMVQVVEVSGLMGGR